MYKAKKMISLFLAITLSLSLLAACSSKKDASGSTSSNPASSETASPEPASTDAAATAEPHKDVTLTLLMAFGSKPQENAVQATIKAFHEKYPYISIDVEYIAESAPSIVNTRLATGDMSDLLIYNTGSLFQALNPEKNFVDLTNEAYMQNVLESFYPSVTANNKLFAVPFGEIMGGGWFYNKKVYADLNLSVPKTWAELMENCAKIKAAGIVPIAATYKDDWTAQIIILADQFNIQAKDPAFAENYTLNKAKISNTPIALRSFEKLEETAKKGFYNKDMNAATLDAGIKLLSEGKAAHYPMLTFAVTNIQQNFPDKLNDIGYFAQPGDDAGSNGLTIWEPGGMYISSQSQHIEEAKLYLEFSVSEEANAVYNTTIIPSGPLLIKGYKLPDSVPQIVKDVAAYTETSGSTAPALEFVSPVKGPSLPSITVEVGSGIKTAKEGALLYDKDIEKQAQQLKLPGW